MLLCSDCVCISDFGTKLDMSRVLNVSPVLTVFVRPGAGDHVWLARRYNPVTN